MLFEDQNGILQGFTNEFCKIQEGQNICIGQATSFLGSLRGQWMAHQRSYRRRNLQAIKQTGSWKALGPNRLHAVFYRKCWNILDKTNYCMIQAFLHHEDLLTELNNINITLFSKKDNPERVNNYRTISLCNVSYKFISKLLANRLRVILLEIISPYKVLWSSKGIFMMIFS